MNTDVLALKSQYYYNTNYWVGIIYYEMSYVICKDSEVAETLKK